MIKEFKIRNIKIGGKNPFVLIAGPCVIESEESILYHAKKLKEITQELNMPFIFKSSYDKANRSSINSYRGPGLKKGLKILNKVKELGIPVLSDVHSVNEISEAAKVLDIIQIPAFLCRQTDLIIECAKTKKPINIKKGQFLSPFDVMNIINKIKSVNNNNKIIITERGVSFGYNNLVNDFRSLLIMKKFGYPICYDVSHSIQQSCGLGDKSGGESEFIPGLSKVGIACGVDALFMEVHRDPKKALCDGPNMFKLNNLKTLLKQ